MARSWLAEVSFLCDKQLHGVSQYMGTRAVCIQLLQRPGVTNATVSCAASQRWLCFSRTQQANKQPHLRGSWCIPTAPHT